MSSASGIRVDSASSASFSASCADDKSLFLRFVINKDHFVCTSKGQAAANKQASWAEIQKALSGAANDPCFVVTRGLSSDPNKWLLIFYMPEGCTVRDRMIYAASAAALKDGLGQSNFEAATFNVSTVAEASAAEYESVSRSMSQDDLLTLDEKTALENETQSALAMSSTKQRAIVGLPIKASDESLEALTSVLKGQPNTVILLLNAVTEVMQVQQAGNFTFEQVQAKLPADEPRYVLQNFAHEHEGEQKNAFVFCYYCPDSIKPKLKMFYSTCKQVVTKVCEGLGIQINKSVELSDPKELSTAFVYEELYPTVAVKKTFAKPSRPGRGNARLITSPGSASSAASASPSP